MNDTLVNIITNIIYIVAVLIVVILIFALINYTLYTIYSIKEIVVHNTSEDAIHYKLKDIYNYKLINYINIINADNNYKYDISSEFNKGKVIDMKEFTLSKYESTPPTPSMQKYIDLSYLKDYKISEETDKKIGFKLKNIDALKPEDFMILYDKISYDKIPIDHTKLIAIYGDTQGKYKIEYNGTDYDEYLKKNNVDININKSLYGDIVSFSKYDNTTSKPGNNAGNPDNTETSKKIIVKDGIIILYKDKNNSNSIEKVSNNTDIYGYILNGLFLLIPTTLLWSNDKYAAGLYVKTNNDLYEIILLLVFLIIFIILMSLINDFYTYIFNITDNSKIFRELFIAKILDRNIHLVVITLCIIIYCIIHSTVYFFVFISGTYKKIKGMYGDLIAADEYIRNETNKYLISNSLNSDAIIEAFNDIAYGGDISYAKGKYNVIDGTTNQDIYDFKKNFEEKMIAINYGFNYDENIYSTNNYTSTFFTKMKSILFYTQHQIDAEIASITVNDAGAITGITLGANKGTYYAGTSPKITIEAPTAANSTQAEATAILSTTAITGTTPPLYEIASIQITSGKGGTNYVEADKSKVKISKSIKHQDINKTLLLVLIIYLYFVKNNIDDPYILIKLNKLIFGRVANTGIPEIDEEIHNTLTLRSLLGHNLENKAIIDDLEYEKTQIFDNIKNNEKNPDVNTKIQGYEPNVKTNVLNFSNKLYVQLDYWGAVYFFNLYLALEIIIGCFVILAILLIIKYTDNDMKANIERYIDKMNELIETIVDEIKTAILGVI
jgi:hypothetical protein